jgi:hypothetical protein
MNEREYYQIRESGTGFGAGGEKRFAVAIVIGVHACRTRAGQSLALNLINMVLRFVNRVTVVLAEDENDLLVRFPYQEPSFQETIRCVHRHCDPRASFTVITPAAQGPSENSPDYSIGVGADVPTDCDLYLSADGFIGDASREPLPDPGPSEELIGAGVAALLGAANVARKMDAVEPLTIRLSGWNFAEGERAEQGPGEWKSLDVGTVRIIGAGAVAGALANWLYQWGVSGRWQIIDRDVIKLKNVSKTLVFSTVDAAEVTPPGIRKVRVLERLLPVSMSVETWYDEWDKRNVPLPDVILPLANERGIRSRVAAESATIVLHATTSTQWQSHVHRHLAGEDDCIACRFPDVAPVPLKCSTGSLADPESPGTTRDASLPFVAGGSGLLLAVMLKRLQLGQLAEVPWNYCTWHWRTQNRFTSTGRHSCRRGCSMYLPTELRRTINAEGRWAHLD